MRNFVYPNGVYISTVFNKIIPAALIAVFSVLAAQTTISNEQKAEHALNRLSFGARPGDVQRVEAMGVKKWIDLQLHPERIPFNPDLEAKLGQFDSLNMRTATMIQSYPTPPMVKAMVAGRIPYPDDPDKRMMVDRLASRLQGKTGEDDAAGKPALATLLTPEQLRTLRAGTAQEKMELFTSFPPAKQDELLESMGQGMRLQLYAAAPPALRRRIQSANGPIALILQDLTAAKLLRAVYSDRQLEEVLGDFWFNHFNVFIEKGADRFLVTSYERDAIRPNVLGKFEDLLRATAQSPAMLFYLDNWESAGAQSPGGMRQKKGLNENYGRELLELHTLGVDGGYTQKDVTEVARCFTGWTIRQPQRAAEFEFNPRMHDAGEKTVLGVKIKAGGGDRGRVPGSAHPGASSGDGAFHFARTGGPVRGGPSAGGFGQPHGRHLPEERRGFAGGDGEYVRFTGVLVAGSVPREDEIAA